MKKLVVVLLAVIALLGCSKIEQPKGVEYVDVTFNYQMVESHSMVRSSNTSEISSFIESLLPETFTFKVGDMTCEIGKPVRIPVGEYTIKYAQGGDKWNLEYSQVSNKPMFSINQTIKVEQGKTNYMLDATYDCSAVVIDLEEVKGLFLEYSSYTSKQAAPSSNRGSYAITFLKGYDSGRVNPSVEVLELRAYPNDSEYVTTYFYPKLSYSREDKKVYLEYGKYYILHPDKVDKVDDMCINVNYPNWIEGSI